MATVQYAINWPHLGTLEWWDDFPPDPAVGDIIVRMDDDWQWLWDGEKWRPSWPPEGWTKEQSWAFLRERGFLE